MKNVIDPSEYSAFHAGTATSGDRGASVVITELFGKGGAAVLLLAVFVAVGLAAAAYANAQATARMLDIQRIAYESRTAANERLMNETKQQAEMLAYYVLDRDTALVNRGLIKRSETFAARKSGMERKQ